MIIRGIQVAFYQVKDSVRTSVGLLRDVVGRERLLGLALIYICLKGALWYLTSNLMLATYKAQGMEGLVYQLHYAIAWSPWALKPLSGAASDLFSISGYKKRWYQILTSMVSITAAFMLLAGKLHPRFMDWMASNIFPFPFWCLQLQAATCDILCEGWYSSMMRQYPELGSSLITYVWLSVQTGSLFAASISGVMLDHNMDVLLVLILIIATFLPLVAFFYNVLQEERIMGSRILNFDLAVWVERRSWFRLAGLMGLLALGHVVVECLTTNYLFLFVYVLLASGILLVSTSLTVPILMAKVNTFTFIQELSYINLTGALDYWYTANQDCIKNGPHFSFTYYQTYGQVIGIAASIVGLLIFQVALGDWNYRSLFFVGTMTKCITSLVDFFILKRWNLQYGIPDSYAFLLGDAVIFPICTVLAHMPAVVLTAKLCPKGMETTSYAILAGLSNFGQLASRSIGVYLLQIFHIHLVDKIEDAKIEDGQIIEGCQSRGLPYLLLFGHTVLPSINIVLCLMLIPNKRLSEPIGIQEERESKEIDNFEIEFGFGSP